MLQADPPIVLRVIRQSEQANDRAVAETKVASTVIATTSITGPSEPWFFELLDSFAALQDLDNALPTVRSGAPYADDVLPGATSLIGLYRANLSHRAEEAVKGMPRARYYLVSIYRTRPSTQSSFADLVRIRRSRLESINFDLPELAYQIISGAPSGTYLFLTPLAALGTLDDGLTKRPEGPRAGPSAESKLAAEVEIGHEYFLFRTDPKKSYVPDDFASADAEFWGVRTKNP